MATVLQREEMERSVVYRHTLSNAAPQQSPYRYNWPSMGWTDDSAQFAHTATPLKNIYFSNGSANYIQMRHATPPGQMGSTLPSKPQHSPTSLSQEEMPVSQVTYSGMSRNSAPKDGIPVTSEQVYAALVSLAIVGVSSAILCVLCVQILNVQYYGYANADDRWTTLSYFLCDLAATICVVAFSLSICAFFTSIFELFLCLKVLKMSPDSHMRIMRFLREAMFIRFLAFVGFFISIPLFLLGVLATMLSVSMALGSFVSAGVLIVVVLVALVICVAVMAHGVYAWLFGSLKLPEFAVHDSAKLVIDRNLSTLV